MTKKQAIREIIRHCWILVLMVLLSGCVCNQTIKKFPREIEIPIPCEEGYSQHLYNFILTECCTHTERIWTYNDILGGVKHEICNQECLDENNLTDSEDWINAKKELRRGYEE